MCRQARIFDKNIAIEALQRVFVDDYIIQIIFELLPHSDDIYLIMDGDMKRISNENFSNTCSLINENVIFNLFF